MHVFTILAISSVAVGGVIPTNATSAKQISEAVTNDYTLPPSLAPLYFGGYISKEVALAGDADTNEVTRSGGEMLRLFEHEGYRGRWWHLSPGNTGYDPDHGLCVRMPPDILTSISFQKQNNDGKPFSCYFYEDDNCRGTNGRLLWLKDSVSNLSNYGWNDRVHTIKCYWTPK